MTMQVTVLTIDTASLDRYQAVPRVGEDVVLVKDNQIIGEGWAGASAHGVVSIEMRDDRAKALIADSLHVKLWEKSFPEKKFKYSTFKFCQYTGQYLDMSDQDADMLCPALEGVYAVDKFNLRYGMVPKFFETMEEYHAVSKEFKAQREAEENGKHISTS